MQTTAILSDISSSYSTSRASFYAYPITAVPDYNLVNINDVVNGAGAVASELFDQIYGKFICTEVELHREKIFINIDDYFKFKDYVESTEVQENPRLENFLKKFS